MNKKCSLSFSIISAFLLILLTACGGGGGGGNNVPVPVSDFKCISKTDTMATFTWSAVSGAISIKIQQSLDGHSWSDSVTDPASIPTTGSTAVVTGLTKDTTYRLRLVVVGGNKPGESNIVSLTTSKLAPITIMVYADMDNNLEAAILDDIREMKEGINDGINLLVLADRNLRDTYPYSGNSSILGANFSDTRIYQITRNKATRLGGGSQFTEITLTSNYEANMGDAYTLKKFIQFCKANYPAQKYMLILSNHGGGPKLQKTVANQKLVNRIICSDETSADDFIYTAELSDVLTANESVDLLVIDACVMGNIELAYQYRPGNGSFEVTTLVASGPNVLDSGFKYDDVLSRLKSGSTVNSQETDITMGGYEKDYDPATASSLEIGGIFVEEQRDFNESLSRDIESLGCFDLTKVKPVKDAVDNLAKQLSLENEKEDFENIRGSLSSPETIHYFSSSNIDEWAVIPFFDLYDLCKRTYESQDFSSTVKEAAKNVMDTVDELTVYSFAGPSYQGFVNGKNGIGITFPDGDRLYNPGGANPYPLWAYQSTYSPLDLTIYNVNGYGKLKWCSDGATPGDGIVSNWFELLDSWFDYKTNGGYNLYEF